MNDKLNIIIDIKKTIMYLDNIIVNYPKVEFTLKNNIDINMYKLLENIYRANIMKDNRVVYQRELLINIKMIDYYLYVSFKKKIISKKNYESSIKYLDKIVRNIYGWINSEKNK